MYSMTIEVRILERNSYGHCSSVFMHYQGALYLITDFAATASEVCRRRVSDEIVEDVIGRFRDKLQDRGL